MLSGCKRDGSLSPRTLPIFSLEECLLARRLIIFLCPVSFEMLTCSFSIVVVRTVLGSLQEIRKKVKETIAARRLQPRESFDLLTAMLHVKDEQTGEGIPDEQIIDECLTFLFAGQDTTGLLIEVFVFT